MRSAMRNIFRGAQFWKRLFPVTRGTEINAALSGVDAEIKAALSRNDRVVGDSRVDLARDATSGAARGISALSPRLGITPVIFKIRRDTPWWKLLENFARRTGAWNSVVLIPSGFRAPCGARRVRLAISAYTHRCDKYSSRVYVYAVGLVAKVAPFHARVGEHGSLRIH